MTIAHVFLAARLALAPVSEDAWLDNPHFVAGSQAYAAEDWSTAADEFALAYAEESEPSLLWAWAQSLRLGRRCAAAVEIYRRFLATSPTEAQQEDTRANIRLCGADPDAPSPPLDAGRRPDPVPPPHVDTPPAAAARRPPSVPPSRDPWAHGLTWPGLAVATVGAVLLGEAHRRANTASSAPDDASFRASTRPIPALERGGIAMLAVGGVLLSAGVIRFAMVVGRHRRTDSR